jgi:phosphoribosylformimino-5-aminoimidazole carboxamide ribotide isomerase
MHVIPAIDIFHDQCVRLTEGNFAMRTDYSFDPFLMAKRFVNAGATHLHVVDLEGAKEGCVVNWSSIEKIRQLNNLFLQVGGGVRTEAEAERLIALGIDRVIVGSIALRSFDVFQRWCVRFGSDRFCIAVDVKDGFLATDGWQEVGSKTIEEILPQFLEIGVRCFLSTDIRRDGTLSGPNIALYSSLVKAFPNVEWIASGGVRSHDDLRALEHAGVAGVVIGKAFYEGTLRLEEMLKPPC